MIIIFKLADIWGWRIAIHLKNLRFSIESRPRVLSANIPNTEEGSGTDATSSITGETIPLLATAKLPRDVWDKLKAQAKQRGVKSEKLLEEIVGNYLDESSEPETQTEPETEPPLTTETRRKDESLVAP